MTFFYQNLWSVTVEGARVTLRWSGYGEVTLTFPVDLRRELLLSLVRSAVWALAETTPFLQEKRSMAVTPSMLVLPVLSSLSDKHFALIASAKITA